MKNELNELNDRQLLAYHKICRMGLKMISSVETRELNQTHLTLTSELISERGLTPKV